MRSDNDSEYVPEVVELITGEVVRLDDIDSNPLQQKKAPIFIMIFIFSAFPGTVLWSTSISRRSLCIQGLESCDQSCTADFDNDELNAFSSQLRAEIDCREDCIGNGIQCHKEVDVLILSVILLAIGFFCGICLFSGLDVILRRQAKSLDEVAHSRAAYREPVYTEEEIRKQLKGKAKKAAMRYPVTDVFCRDCGVAVEVDRRWLEGELGALAGSICPRCRNTVVGML